MKIIILLFLIVNILFASDNMKDYITENISISVGSQSMNLTEDIVMESKEYNIDTTNYEYQIVVSLPIYTLSKQSTSIEHDISIPVFSSFANEDSKYSQKGIRYVIDPFIYQKEFNDNGHKIKSTGLYSWFVGIENKEYTLNNGKKLEIKL